MNVQNGEEALDLEARQGNPSKSKIVGTTSTDESTHLFDKVER
jgi:hypothetical protein